MVVATLVATVTTPKSTWPRQKIGEEGGVMHGNRGVKEEARSWRMLTTTTNNNPPNNMRVALTSTVVAVVANSG